MILWAPLDFYWETKFGSNYRVFCTPDPRFLFLPGTEPVLSRAVSNAIDAEVDPTFLLTAPPDVVKEWAEAEVMCGDKLKDWLRHARSDG